MERLVQANVPLGLNLKSMGILQPEQLKLLFSIQVLRQVCSLFQVEAGQFRFDAKADLPKSELTGLSLPATETTLMGLRSLKDWKILQSKLPSPDSTLFNLISGQPNLRLDASEAQVWRLADGSMNLKKMAEQFQIPIQKVQQIAFRLIGVGLVEEVPDIDAGIINIADSGAAINGDTSGQVIIPPERTQISNSFLQSLVGFLQHKA